MDSPLVVDHARDEPAAKQRVSPQFILNNNLEINHRPVWIL